MDRELKLFGRKLKGGYSTIDTISVKWLRHFTWIYLGSVVLTTVLFGLQNLGLIPLEIPQVFAIIYGVLILSVFYLNYEGIRHYTLNEVNNVNNQNEVVPSNAEEGSTPVSKFKNTTPLSEKEKALEQKMLDLIGEKKLYLETRFSLKDLASHLDESTHTISRIINSRDGRSFYDLINGYRVNHLKKMLDDPRNSQFTILSMGLESGFNSKATMNRIFKNTTGLSPKEYLQQKS